MLSYVLLLGTIPSHCLTSAALFDFELLTDDPNRLTLECYSEETGWPDNDAVIGLYKTASEGEVPCRNVTSGAVYNVTAETEVFFRCTGSDGSSQPGFSAIAGEYRILFFSLSLSSCSFLLLQLIFPLLSIIFLAAHPLLHSSLLSSLRAPRFLLKFPSSSPHIFQLLFLLKSFSSSSSLLLFVLPYFFSQSPPPPQIFHALSFFGNCIYVLFLQTQL